LCSVFFSCARVSFFFLHLGQHQRWTHHLSGEREVVLWRPDTPLFLCQTRTSVSSLWPIFGILLFSLLCLFHPSFSAKVGRALFFFLFFGVALCCCLSLSPSLSLSFSSLSLLLSLLLLLLSLLLSLSLSLSP